MMNIREAIARKEIFGAAIKNIETLTAWLTFLSAMFGLPMSPGEADIFRACTGRQTLPTAPFAYATLICGRRAGKSFVMALIAVYLAVFRDYREFLTLGERGTIMIVAADRRQARVIMRYVKGILALPVFAKLIERETTDSFDLTNQVTIEIATASIRAVRGYSIVAALLDEIAFFPAEDSASPDFEIVASILPAMATIPGSVLIKASSPYARRGVLWEDFERHFGRDSAPTLVWQAATRVMNPTVPQAFIDAAFERDPASASSEYDAKFRTDIEALVRREVVDAVTVRGRFELSMMSSVSYFAFVDPSGGSVDAMTMAIAHMEGSNVVLDMVREVKAPFSPDAVTKAFADDLKRWGLSSVTGDRYGGEWPAERFGAHGIEYKTSERSRSEIYLELLPLLNGRRVELLDNPRMINQLVGLERKTARGGRDSIDHAPNGHDDMINSAAGALVLALGDDDNPWATLSRNPPGKTDAAYKALLRGGHTMFDESRKALDEHFAKLDPHYQAAEPAAPAAPQEPPRQLRRGEIFVPGPRPQAPPAAHGPWGECPPARRSATGAEAILDMLNLARINT